MIRIKVDFENKTCEIQGEDIDVKKGTSKSVMPSPTDVLMQGNLAACIWEVFKSWQIDGWTGGAKEVKEIIGAVVKSKEMDAAEKKDILDKVNKRK